MPLSSQSPSDTICNAALRDAMEPFVGGSTEFDVTSGARPGVTWRAVEDDMVMVLQLGTEDGALSYVRLYEKGDPVVFAGFGEGGGWIETLVAGKTVRSTLVDDEVKAWISDLEATARKSIGEGFVAARCIPKP